MLGKLVIEKDIFLIVDEVYREFIHNGDPHYSVLCDSRWSEHSVMIDSVSKRYSMCGARVGCMVSRNKKLLKQALNRLFGGLSVLAETSYSTETT